MIIENSQLSLSSRHQLINYEEEHERLEVRHARGREGDARAALAGLSFKSDRVSISIEAQSQVRQTGFDAAQGSNPIPEVDDLDEDMKLGWKLKLLKSLVEKLTGREIRTFKVAELKPTSEGPSPAAAPAPEGDVNGSSESLGWGVSYDYHHSYYEAEQTTFNATGLVNTADGRQIEIALNLSMSRSFAAAEHISLRAGDALKDPLVINYAGTAAQLDTTELNFDLDLDGSADRMHFLTPGSGFLALDQNGDGLINDGRELFGPTSGDGYAELADYDSDGNHWIDENDDVFSRLRIWAQDTDGTLRLFSLADQGVGAISLAHAATPFSLNDSDNNQLGQVRDSGLFLYESGMVGSVQQIDLAV